MQKLNSGNIFHGISPTARLGNLIPFLFSGPATLSVNNLISQYWNHHERMSIYENYYEGCSNLDRKSLSHDKA
jgi:hypothetical protein